MNTLSPIIIPVLPSANIQRDLKWYEQHTGFQYRFGDDQYAGLQRDNLEFHQAYCHSLARNDHSNRQSTSISNILKS